MALKQPFLVNTRKIQDFQMMHSCKLKPEGRKQVQHHIASAGESIILETGGFVDQYGHSTCGGVIRKANGVGFWLSVTKLNLSLWQSQKSKESSTDSDFAGKKGFKKVEFSSDYVQAINLITRDLLVGIGLCKFYFCIWGLC